MKIMAIDPGDKRIGLAISDDLEFSINPIGIINHESRKMDAESIIKIAHERKAELLVIGCALDENGDPTISGRKAMRLADILRELTIIPVELMDESYSTNEATGLGIEMGLSKNQRKGHRDEIAAMIILQRYIDARRREIL